MLMDGDFLGITLDELHGATIFNIMRNQAMHNADESALFYVYRVLQRWEFMVGCGSRVLLDQLRKEYGIAFENVMKAVDGGNPPAPPKVSTEEIDKMLVFLKKKSRRFVPELRNYNPGIKGKKTLPRGIQVTRQLSVMLGVLILDVLGRAEEGLDRYHGMAGGHRDTSCLRRSLGGD